MTTRHRLNGGHYTDTPVRFASLTTYWDALDRVPIDDRPLFDARMLGALSARVSPEDWEAAIATAVAGAGVGS